MTDLATVPATALPAVWLPWLLKGTAEGDEFLAATGVNMSYLRPDDHPQLGERPTNVTEADWLIAEQTYQGFLEAAQRVLTEATWRFEATVHGPDGSTPLLAFFGDEQALAVRIAGDTAVLAVEAGSRLADGLPQVLAELAVTASRVTASAWRGERPLGRVVLKADDALVELDPAVGIPAPDRLETATMISALLETGRVPNR